MEKRNSVGNTIGEVLAQSDVKSIIDRFQEKDLATAKTLLMIYMDDQGYFHMLSAGIGGVIPILGYLEYAKYFVSSDPELEEMK